MPSHIVKRYLWGVDTQYVDAVDTDPHLISTFFSVRFDCLSCTMGHAIYKSFGLEWIECERLHTPSWPSIIIQSNLKVGSPAALSPLSMTQNLHAASLGRVEIPRIPIA